MFASGNNNGGYSLADIAAATGNGHNNNDGFGGGNSWWVILLFIFMLFGWGGNRNYGNNGGNSGGNNTTFIPYPMMGGYGFGGFGPSVNYAVQNDVQRGFDQSAIISGINGIQTSINTGFSNAEVSRCNAQANLLQTLNNNQMGLYQTLNNNQVGILQGFNGVQSQLAQCCCDNRAATQDVKYTIATENCADRAALSDGVNRIIDSQTNGVQTILDKLCQLELDGVKQNYENKIYTMQLQADQLRAENVALRGDISQANQTAAIEASQNNQTNRIIDAINPTPVPAYPVANPYGCNCNCNNNRWYNNGCCGN